MNIAVFVFAYPVLSETFVLNELFQLQEKGANGSIWREKSGNGAAHPKVSKLHFPIFNCPEKIFGPVFFSLVKDHIWWVAHHPLRYIRLLIEILQKFPDTESVKIFVKSAQTARQVLLSKCELVYVHEADRAFVFGLCAGRLCGIPLTVIFHTYYLFVQKRYVTSKVQVADGVVFQSDYSKILVSTLLSNEPKLVEKMSVISSPGIDTDFFSPKSWLDKALNYKSIPLRIVSVGRLEEAKGFEFLIDAIALLRDSGADVSCRIIGEGSFRKKIETKIKQHNLQNSVRLLGALAHGSVLQDELRAAEYFVLPSVQDSDGVHDVHPNAVKEAMAAGLLVVTTKLGGIDEVIQDGVDGCLIETAEPQEIFSKLKEVSFWSESKKTRMKTAARTKIIHLYSADKITKRLMRFLKNYVK